MNIFHILFDLAVIYGLVKFFKWGNMQFGHYRSPDKANKRWVR